MSAAETVTIPVAVPTADTFAPHGAGVLHRGSWHADPSFEGPEQSVLNLEPADTDVVGHDTCDLAARFGRAFRPSA